MNARLPHPPIEQMELTLDTASRARRRRQTVSHWWFARMREAVRTAREWPSCLDAGNWAVSVTRDSGFPRHSKGEQEPAQASGYSIAAEAVLGG
jgi:hypothetical protein